MCAPMVCMFPCTRVHVQTCLIYQSSYSVIYLSIHIGPFANSKCWPAYLVRAGEYRRIPPSVHQLACFFPSHSMSLQAMAGLRRKMPSGRSIDLETFSQQNNCSPRNFVPLPEPDANSQGKHPFAHLLQPQVPVPERIRDCPPRMKMGFLRASGPSANSTRKFSLVGSTV